MAYEIATPVKFGTYYQVTYGLDEEKLIKISVQHWTWTTVSFLSSIMSLRAVANQLLTKE